MARTDYYSALGRSIKAGETLEEARGDLRNAKLVAAAKSFQGISPQPLAPSAQPVVCIVSGVQVDPNGTFARFTSDFAKIFLEPK